jgi:uncharacterized membrane protein
MLRKISIPVTAAVLSLLGVALADSHFALAVPVGVLAVLVAPGLSVQHLLFPESQVSGAERAALTVGLSFAIVIVAALGLNAVTKLTPLTWSLALALITCASAVAAAGRTVTDRSLRSARPTKPLGARRGAAIGLSVLAVLLITAAFSLAVRGASHLAARSHFTEAWLLPNTRDPGLAVFGLQNREGHRVTYRVVVQGKHRHVVRQAQVTLNNDGWWRETMPIPPTRRLIARVYLADRPTAVYRMVKLAGGG